MNLLRALAAATLICGVSSATFAQHDDDVILAVQDGRVVTGEMHDGAFEESRLWIIAIDSGITDEPGFDAPTGAFPGGATTGITARRALRAWDYDDGHFHAVAQETMVMSRFTLSMETPAVDPCFGQFPSLQLGVTSSAGSLHVHPWYQLTAPMSDGMYLLELEFWINPSMQPAIQASRPFWIIFTKNEFDAFAIEEAEDWVIANLVDMPVPCPGDLTGNGSIGVPDLLALLAAWGPNPGHPADLNCDGVVGVADLLVLLSLWGPCP